ncbi:hypothetical protein GGR54DRAFT_421213 [Hypoxylon sp. NC1633]|nr:hypothetical protein GGR54DRAFT_421213 [Hypoxylon sp. NC1633]
MTIHYDDQAISMRGSFLHINLALSFGRWQITDEYSLPPAYPQSEEPEALISRLSNRPPVIKKMLMIADPLKRTNWKPVNLAVGPDRIPSLGMLDRLPTEILLIILPMLDMQSSVRLARASFRGNALVQSQDGFKDLATHARQELVALRHMGLLGLHSIAALDAALRMDRCVACGGFGAYLFLPTCVRCCYECLESHPSFWMLSSEEAQRCFGLSSHHIQQLPKVHYSNHKRSADLIQCELVSAKAARALGLAVHGSEEKLARAMESNCKSQADRKFGRFVQSGPAVSQQLSQGHLPSLWREEVGMDVSEFFGTAFFRFPLLSKSGMVERGLWCKGCQHNFDHGAQLPLDVLATLMPRNSKLGDAQKVLQYWVRRAWSRESFLDHIRHCHGAQLVPKPRQKVNRNKPLGESHGTHCGLHFTQQPARPPYGLHGPRIPSCIPSCGGRRGGRLQIGRPRI